MQKINFQNLPSTSTPVNATNLNAIQSNVEDVFNGTVPMGNIVVDSIKSKNIFNENEILNINGWTKDNNGYYNGTSTDIRGYYQNKDYTGMFEANTQYTFQWTGYLGTATNVRMKFNYTDDTTSGTTGMTSSTSATYTATSTSGKTVKSIEIDYGTFGTFYIKDIQLEKGETATTYVPYQALSYESGKNTNGEYIKCDDGTLIQWGNISVTTGTTSSSIGGLSVYSGTEQSITLPISFINQDYFISTQIHGGDNSKLNFIYLVKTSKSVVTINMTSTSSSYTRTIMWQTIGRWK